MTDTTNTAKLDAVSTMADLLALAAAQIDDQPAPDQEATPADARATRAVSVVPALAPYAEDRDRSDYDFEGAIVDLVGDLRHLADHLGVDFRQVIWRSARDYRLELKNAA